MGVDHVAYEVASLTDLLETWEDLKGKGIAPYWCVNHGMSASLYYADPDGNQMEFSVDLLCQQGGNAAIILQARQSARTRSAPE